MYKLQISADLLVSDVHIHSKFNLSTARPSRALVPGKAGGHSGNCQSKRDLLKRFFPSVRLLMALAEMSELRKTPPLQLLLGKSRKIQLNLLGKKLKRNSCYSERISVLPSVPLEFSVRQSVNNNQDIKTKSLVAVIFITLCIPTSNQAT